VVEVDAPPLPGPETCLTKNSFVRSKIIPWNIHDPNCDTKTRQHGIASRVNKLSMAGIPDDARSAIKLRTVAPIGGAACACSTAAFNAGSTKCHSSSSCCTAVIGNFWSTSTFCSTSNKFRWYCCSTPSNAVPNALRYAPSARSLASTNSRTDP
jgi:hypothetical protein